MRRRVGIILTADPANLGGVYAEQRRVSERCWRLRRFGAAIVGFAIALTTLVAAPHSHATKRPLGDSRVVARMPAAPGYPEGIVVQGSTVYIATAARFGTSVVPPKGPPEVQAFDTKTGEVRARFAIADQDPNRDHGTSGLAFDAAGRLYVLDTQWGIVRFDPATAPASIDPAADPSVVYGTSFPDLRPCAAFTAGPCSPTAGDAPSLPNDLAFDAEGNAYVTDSLQATIWRVPAGGGAPEIWFQDPRLDGGFGPNGIRLDAARNYLYFVVSADRTGTGHIYRLPLATPARDRLESFHAYRGGEVPDNIAWGRSGKLYVALAGTNEIQIVLPDGREQTRFSGPARSADGDVPYDMPSGVTLDDSTSSLFVNNHSEVLGLPERFVIFDIYVDDRAEPLIRPTIE